MMACILSAAQHGTASSDRGSKAVFFFLKKRKMATEKQMEGCTCPIFRIRDPYRGFALRKSNSASYLAQSGK